jgi:hydroxypyruvate reductase
LAVVRAGIRAVAPSRLLNEALTSPTALPGDALRVVCAGKAATAMASAIDRLYGPSIRGGLIVGAAMPPDMMAPFELIPGSHPVPGPDSERAGRAALRLARSLEPDETLVVLLSGGASAMMAVPGDGVSLDDKRRTTELLLKSGADIVALNTVRKHLSGIKGGQLAAATRGPSRTYAISDVVGDDLSVIASGPTVPDETTFDDALRVLMQFGGTNGYPPAVVARLEAGRRGEVEETPKPGDPKLARAQSKVIGSRREAMNGAVLEAESLGYRVFRIDDAVVGEARTTAVSHLREVIARADGVPRPACFVSSGETTVRVTGRGKGGRNQEFALAVAPLLAAFASPAAAASAGTDGIDGPTDAAGGLVDSTTVERVRLAGLPPLERFLAENDAYACLDAIGDLIKTGPTGTNVGDLQVVMFG